MAITPWRNLQSGKIDLGLQDIRDEYRAEQTPSATMELGIAYLWSGDYLAAWSHFYEFNQHYPSFRADSFYGMCGVAKWCSGDYHTAAGAWRDGLECNYADVAGGLRLPLLLWCAAVLEPSFFALSEAENTLKERTADPRARYWPGPLAEFVLGRIDESTLQRRCVDEQDDETFENRWRSNFYIGVREFSLGNHERWRELMHETATVDDEDFDASNDNRYLMKFWHEEFFIARHEMTERANRA